MLIARKRRGGPQFFFHQKKRNYYLGNYKNLFDMLPLKSEMMHARLCRCLQMYQAFAIKVNCHFFEVYFTCFVYLYICISVSIQTPI